MFALFAVGLGLVINGALIFQDHEVEEPEPVILIPENQLVVINGTEHPPGTGPSTTEEIEVLLPVDPVDFFETCLENCVALCFEEYPPPVLSTEDVEELEAAAPTQAEYLAEVYNEELNEALAEVRECEIDCAHDCIGEEEEEEEEEELNPGTPWLLSGVLLVVFALSACLAFGGWFVYKLVKKEE